MKEQTVRHRSEGDAVHPNAGATDGAHAADATSTADNASISARSVGFWHDLRSVGRRAVMLLPRDMAALIPALLGPVFFYAVVIGALQDIANSAAPDLDYKAFQLPVALVTMVTGLSRAPNLVMDIKGGYFDRLLLTPLNRWALLLGMLVADVVVFVGLSIPVVVLGLVLGVTFATGIAGIVTFMAVCALWGLVFTGFPYTIALRTGNPTAVNSTWVVFFPIVFLTPAWLPREAMTGWLSAVAAWNPVTYILEGLRTLFVTWDGVALGKALAAVLGVGIVSQYMAFSALRHRTRP